MAAQLWKVAAALGLAASVVACTDATDPVGGVDAGVGPGDVSALFELPGAGGQTSDFYALPFPSDLRLRADGTVDLDGHSRDGNQLLDEWLDLFSTKTRGFGTNSAVYFRFSGAIDEASLPADPAATATDAASVYLVDVDPDSPERGSRIPLRLRFEREAGRGIGANWLALLPYPGFPLRPATTYAAVVTRRVTSGNEPVGSSDDFERVRSGAAAAELYAPLVTWLAEAGGDELDDVASATVFTTQDPVSLMGKLRAVVRRPCTAGQTFPACVPAPVARDVRRTGTTAELDIFEGTYDTPLFQNGEIPYSTEGGEILVDSAGEPIPQRMTALRFALTIPNGTMPAGGWPIVVYAHGTGGDYRSFIDDKTAARMAAQGLAVISIDQVLHGPRDPSNGSVELSFFNFFNPVAARDNVRQGAADDFQLVRLAETMTVAEGAETHRFDPERISFMGHSQGGLTGPPFLAYEPNVKGAVLSGAGGLIYIALLYKTNPPTPSIPGVVSLFIRDEPLDEFNPFLSLVQMFIEPADPMNYARLLVREPPPGVPAKDIFQSEGLVDTYAPILGIEAFGVAMGLSPVAPVMQDVPGFALRGRPVLTAPVSANMGERTGVFLQYTAPSNSDGHFVIFRVAAAQRQHAAFLGSLARTGTATLAP